jgi:hypothetical protein
MRFTNPNAAAARRANSVVPLFIFSHEYFIMYHIFLNTNWAHLLSLACGPTKLLLADCLHGTEPRSRFTFSVRTFEAMLGNV